MYKVQSNFVEKVLVSWRYNVFIPWIKSDAGMVTEVVPEPRLSVIVVQEVVFDFVVRLFWVFGPKHLVLCPWWAWLDSHGSAHKSCSTLLIWFSERFLPCYHQDLFIRQGCTVLQTSKKQKKETSQKGKVQYPSVYWQPWATLPVSIPFSTSIVTPYPGCISVTSK
jgi:hypothetical protein